MLTELEKALKERDLAWKKYRQEYDKVLNDFKNSSFIKVLITLLALILKQRIPLLALFQCYHLSVQ